MDMRPEFLTRPRTLVGVHPELRMSFAEPDILASPEVEIPTSHRARFNREAKPLIRGGQFLFPLLVFGNVPRDPSTPDSFASWTLYRRNTQGYVNSFPRFGETNGFKMFDATSCPQRFENLVLLIRSFRRDNNVDWLAQRFCCLVPVKALSAWVPTYDNAIQSHRHNRIFRRFHDCGIPDLGFFCLLLISNVLHHCDHQRRWTAV